jgi:hypothetical protein
MHFLHWEAGFVTDVHVNHNNTLKNRQISNKFLLLPILGTRS